jgi:hypothetical protein
MNRTSLDQSNTMINSSQMAMNPGGDTMAPENNEPLYARGKKEFASTVKKVEVDIKR